MPSPARSALLLACLSALLAPGCAKTDPKTEASLAKLEADSAANKASLAKVEDELKRSQEEQKKAQTAAAELSADLKKLSENLTGLRLEFAKAAPGIVSLPPPKEEKLEKAQLNGTFKHGKGLQGAVNFSEPFAFPPTIEFGKEDDLLVTECTVSGFKWKDVLAEGLVYRSTPTARWTATGVRKVQPGNAALAAAKAEENAKYGKQIAEQFLKAFAALKFVETKEFVTDNYHGAIAVKYNNNFGQSMMNNYYAVNNPVSGENVADDQRFKSATISTTTLSPNGNELLCTGVLEGDKRKADFTLILVPAQGASWRVDTFTLTDRPAEKK